MLLVFSAVRSDALNKEREAINFCMIYIHFANVAGDDGA